MKAPILRLFAIAAAIGVVANCGSATAPEPFGSGGAVGGGGGGSGSSGSTGPGDKQAPTVTIDTPAVGALVNIGDSVLVAVRLHDDNALQSLALAGVKLTGSADLGTLQRTIRYTEVTVPVGGVSFRPSLRDTTIRRYLHPAQPLDTTLDSLIVMAVVTDTAGNVDTTSRAVNLVTGPRVTVVTPASGDSVPAGVGMTVTLHATHAQGVARLSFHAVGDSTWPTKLDTTISSTYPPNSTDVQLSGIVRIPSDAPVGGRVKVTSSATDVNGQPGGAAPISVIVRGSTNAEPLVTQSLAARSEIGDSVSISANGDGIQMVGFVVLDTLGVQIKRDSVSLPTPYASNSQQRMDLNLPATTQGSKVFVYTFAKDQGGRVGYSIKLGTTVPQATEASAYTDSTLVAYGQTFAVPRSGIIGDIAVDPVHGHVFLSNTAHNLLEVWSNATHTFSANGVAVGALPWGMDISTNPNYLLVANSGGTNISEVNIASADPASISEDLSKRILTRNTVVYVLHQTATPNSDSSSIVYRLSAEGPIEYSDRPQYVEQGAGGLIYYSTQPTGSATPGTIRVIDPTQTVPDPRHLWQYGTEATDESQIALFNVDSMVIVKAPQGATDVSDQMVVCDHTPGSATVGTCVTDSTYTGMKAKLVAAVSSDVQTVVGLDVTSLDMTDTTFVARSADRKWIGFGEGNTKSAAARVIMAHDAATFGGLQVSTTIPMHDLIENASEIVTGLAIDSTGLVVGAHGSQESYFAAVPDYLHLRLQGTYDSQDQGAGIAFHPGANGYTTDGADQVAFVASASGKIEIVDMVHYNNRGTLQLKYPVYGPLRATRPLPGDPAGVILKLYAMTTHGLVVIDLRAGDIDPP
ncbi:MAG TPA: hypothetical protein VFK16_00925 [Gemmatimonadaceae bacterium]|nr:hypothetical protein [Gemmatimonadaceae bacterium]